VLGDEVVVAVVMEDAASSQMGAGGDHEIRWREAVVTDRRQLALGIESDALDRAVDREAGQVLEATHQLPMIPRRSRRVTGLEQEG